MPEKSHDDNVEEGSDETRKKVDAKIYQIIFIASSFPRESADFRWSCRQYESVVNVPCEVDLYASLPAYIDRFCSMYLISTCDILRAAIFSSVRQHETQVVPAS